MDPITGMALAQGGASVIGGMMNSDAQDSANNRNHIEAEINRGFQERMRSTSHQTEVQDLIKAGLNPILSAGGQGAAMASGSTATADAAKPGDGISNGISSALGVATASKGLQATNENILNTKADTTNKNEQTALIGEQTKATAAQAKLAQTTSNQITQMLPSMLKKAQADGDFARVNNIMGIAQSGISSANGIKDLLNPAKGLLGNPLKAPNLNPEFPNPKFGTPFKP